ncbi:MAG TPA: hypothetical protein VKW78_02045 [Terriglobales bacterium]|nr:hypothetical protein [Terriglobales bacterium]
MRKKRAPASLASEETEAAGAPQIRNSQQPQFSPAASKEYSAWG